MARAAGLLLLALLGAGALLVPRPPVDNSVEALLSADAPEAVRYRAYADTFGDDEIVLVHVSGGALPAVLDHAARAQAILQAQPMITGVVAPGTVFADLVDALADPVARDLVDADERAHTLSGPLNEALPVLRAGTSSGAPSALVLAFGTAASVPAREALLAALDGARAAAAADGVTLRIAGPPLLNLALDAAGRDVERTALPLLAGLCFVLLFASTRRLTVAVALLAPVGLGVASTDVALGLAGLPSNVLANVAKPLLLVLLLAAGLHVAVRAEDLRRAGAAPAEAATRAARDRGRAVALALLTTAIGFGSLGLSDVGPIRTFGLLSALGLLLGVPLTLLSTPALLGLLARAPAPARPSPLAGLAERLVQAGLRRRRAAVASALLLAALGAAAIPRLRADPHAIKYFAEDHPLRADYAALEAAGLGLSTVEVVLTATAAWSLDPATQARVERVRAAAEARPGVTAALALPLVLREAQHQVRRRGGLPDADFAADALDERPALRGRLLGDDGRALRLSLLIETLDAAALDDLQTSLQKVAQDALPNATVTFTGSYPLLLRAQRSLLTTLRDSLLVTLALMEIVLLLFLRRPTVALIALLPNLLPVAVNFAVMALLDLPVDLGTSMTAAVALGIAVDDTLHVCVAWREGGAEGLAARCGRAVVTSSLVIGLGFFSLATSSFAPTRNFGLLAGFAMATALFADLVVLPGLLAWADARGAGVSPRGRSP